MNGGLITSFRTVKMELRRRVKFSYTIPVFGKIYHLMVHKFVGIKLLVHIATLPKKNL